MSIIEYIQMGYHMMHILYIHLKQQIIVNGDISILVPLKI